MGIFSKKNKKKRKKTKSKSGRRRSGSPDRARAFLWWLIGLCTAIVFVMVFVLSDHGLYELYKLKQEQHLIEDHIKNLQAENAALSKEKDRLKNDIDYIEKLAREKYRMAKKGEKVFRVIPKSKREEP